MSGKGMAATGAVAVGAALAFACPAVAEPPSGDYTMTLTDAVDTYRPGSWRIGSHGHLHVTPCGPECIHINNWESDMHLQGDSWTGSSQDGCTDTINSQFTVYINTCQFWTLTWDVTKDA